MYHPAGTATMGHEDNPDAVVDPELRFDKNLIWVRGM
jgi:choline dehydrogenase-like flavoprotein